MLKLKVWGSGNPKDYRIMTEGHRSANGMCILTKETLERVANLPEGYTVGTVTKNSYGFHYEVIEV